MPLDSARPELAQLAESQAAIATAVGRLATQRNRRFWLSLGAVFMLFAGIYAALALATRSRAEQVGRLQSQAACSDQIRDHFLTLVGKGLAVGPPIPTPGETPEERAAKMLDYQIEMARHRQRVGEAADFMERAPEICYGDEPDLTPFNSED